MSESYRTSASIANLRSRSRLAALARTIFDRVGFVEVHPPVLGSEFVIDRHIDPIEVGLQIDGHARQTYYLQSSPEAAMKRLMTSGLERIYSLGPVFRAGEFGRLHNPEFTMLEWYRVGDDMDSACDFLSSVVSEMLGRPVAKRVTFADKFHELTSFDLFSATLSDFANIASQFSLGVESSFSTDWDDWVNLIFSEVMQPKLGFGSPETITNFPASQSALARLGEDQRTAERFEIFVDGIELANGYCELLDADELQRRSERENKLRLVDGKSMLPIPSKLIAAMRSGLPPMSGCALGFDRLVMLAVGANTLQEVLCFSSDCV